MEKPDRWCVAAMRKFSKTSHGLIVCLLTSSVAAIAAVAPDVTSDSPPGTILWEFPAGIVYGPPAVAADGTVYVVGGYPNYKLYALTSTGAKKWEIDHDYAGGGSPAIAADGTVYVGAERELRAYTPNGDLVWATGMN